MSISKIFIPNCVRVLTNKRKYIEQNFYSVAGVMPQGWDLGVLGGQKTLASGFAMVPHTLHCSFLHHFMIQGQIIHLYIIS